MSQFHRILPLLILGWLLSLGRPGASAQGGIVDVCPGVGMQSWSEAFTPDGIILTTFDSRAIWVYNVASNSRYPLPDTHPCGSNCRLSRDARWVTYYNPATFTIDKMRFDGTQRTTLATNAADLEWWSDDTLLVWTTNYEAYLRPEASDEREYLPAEGLVSVQPGGYWGLTIQQDGDDFRRVLVDLQAEEDTTQPINLGLDTEYFNSAAWSPNGQWLAYVSRGAVDPTIERAGGELFLIRPGSPIPEQLTYLTLEYGAVRINGRNLNELSWAPSGDKLAFWVIELIGPDVEGNTGQAVIHVADVATGEISRYCGFATDEHTPNPPRLMWSPDETKITFGGNVPGDDKGYLLLALDVESGVFTELSEGVFPALGRPDVIGWGLP